jgi:hypothetical protein
VFVPLQTRLFLYGNQTMITNKQKAKVDQGLVPREHKYFFRSSSIHPFSDLPPVVSLVFEHVHSTFSISTLNYAGVEMRFLR